jgi:hypothetical protein
MRLFAIPVLLVLLSLELAGCGAGGTKTARSTHTGETDTATAPDWAGRLLNKAGPARAAIMANSDFAVGRNRVSFVLLRGDNSLIRAPRADVYYKPSAGAPTTETLARLVSIGAEAPPADKDDVTEIYVATLQLPRAGKHWIVVQPRGIAFQGFQILDVKASSTAIAIGSKAPASHNPTLATRPASKITTARPPDTPLLKYSIADSLQAKKPFVVAFATPAFCQSRTCGPTVDVVDAVRKRFQSRGIRFIHVEIFEDNSPEKGLNRWVREWRLPSEPWVYVVGRDGVVRDRFEGAISVPELEQSIRRNLLR